MSALAHLSNDELAGRLGVVRQALYRDRQENQILLYEPVSARARAFHASQATVVGVGGGNRSSKTTTALVHEIALATGMFPRSIADLLKPQFKGPLRVRICIESFLTHLHPLLLPKLRYERWSGLPPQGGAQGHWGLVPKVCLKHGDWDRSWSEKHRMLTLLCRDPDNPQTILGESVVQFMSYDQDPSEYASGDWDIVHMDEPPTHAIWRENRTRTMGVGGRTFLTMTWPDDPSIPVDWLFDEVYDKGREGPEKDPGIDWIELSTLENRNIDQVSTRKAAQDMSEEERAVRIYGRTIRFSNRIHPLFTNTEEWWSFAAGRTVIPIAGTCPSTGSSEIAPYCHVREFEHQPFWPAVFVLDPHPRKAHMFLWAMVDPNDDVWIVADGECKDEPLDVRRLAEQVEADLGLRVALRLIDPNMGRSPSSTVRDVTWQDEFAHAGLICDLADDSDVGRGRINEYLKPDRATRRPRLHIHPRCRQTVFQMMRYVWGEWRQREGRDLKQTPKDMNDDYPTMLKYFMNIDPRFALLKDMGRVVRRTGTRRGAY